MDKRRSSGKMINTVSNPPASIVKTQNFSRNRFIKAATESSSRLGNNHFRNLDEEIDIQTQQYEKEPDVQAQA